MEGGHGDTAKAALLNEQEREKSVVISDPSRPDNPMIYVSEEFETQTGYPPEEALGRNCRFLQGPETDPKAVRAIRRCHDAPSRAGKKRCVTSNPDPVTADGTPATSSAGSKPAPKRRAGPLLPVARTLDVV